MNSMASPQPQKKQLDTKKKKILSTNCTCVSKTFNHTSWPSSVDGVAQSTVLRIFCQYFICLFVYVQSMIFFPITWKYVYFKVLD